MKLTPIEHPIPTPSRDLNSKMPMPYDTSDPLTSSSLAALHWSFLPTFSSCKILRTIHRCIDRASQRPVLPFRPCGLIPKTGGVPNTLLTPESCSTARLTEGLQSAFFCGTGTFSRPCGMATKPPFSIKHTRGTLVPFQMIQRPSSLRLFQAQCPIMSPSSQLSAQKCCFFQNDSPQSNCADD